MGDLARGRTVRSLAWLLTLYRGVKQYFVAPPNRSRSARTSSSMLRTAGVAYELSADFEKIIPEVDAIYMTRIQDEWDTADESRRSTPRRFHFTARASGAPANPMRCCMHPLPRRKEIAIEVDHDPRAMYWRQVRNGMWIRAALILTIFDRCAEIDKYYEDLTS